MTNPPTRDLALAAYMQRRQDRAAALKTQVASSRRLSNLRLAVFAGGLLTAGFALGTGLYSPYWALLWAAVFIVLIVRHDRVIRECERLERAVDFYDRGLARLEDRWAGRGKSGNRFRDADHPYAEDLDLFGRGSLFERLCTAQTTGGEECLAAWLKAPARPDTIAARREAVSELRDLLDLREELDLLAVVTQKRVEPGHLVQWAATPVSPLSGAIRVAIGGLAAAGIAATINWAITSNLAPLLITIAAGQLIVYPFRRKVGAAAKGVDRMALELSHLGPVLGHLETDDFRSSALVALKQRIEGPDGKSVLSAIQRLQTLDGYMQMQGNLVTRVIAEVLHLIPQISSAIADWRLKYGSLMADWIAVVGEFEALNALASYTYENPEDVFSTFQPDGPIFAAEGIAHPLLPLSTAVRNDLIIDDARRLYVVSGSNMSGKSTLLRAIGANAVLAQAGAPVRATALTMSSLQVGASIRTQDSLQEGVSRFYAEIRRLRAIVDLASLEPPALFLLDEILHGTNSHDRRIGAEAVARALIDRGAIGLLTTHDLALARIAEDPGAHAVNVHFQDDLVDGTMSFDYHLREGVVEKSNALALMRAVGLEV